MQFRVGDKVKCKEKSLSGFSSSVIKTVKCGGTIVNITRMKGFPLVEFADGKKYFMWKDDLELLIVKHQQLLFAFMEK